MLFPFAPSFFASNLKSLYQEFFIKSRKMQYNHEAIFQRFKKVIDGKLKNRSQAQVARDLGISPSRLNRYLKRKDDLSLEVVVKLIAIYKEPSNYILFGKI